MATQAKIALKELNDLAANRNQARVELEELRKTKPNYASHLVSLEDGWQELSTKLSMVEGEKEEAEKKLTEVKSHIKDSDR